MQEIFDEAKVLKEIKRQKDFTLLNLVMEELGEMLEEAKILYALKPNKRPLVLKPLQNVNETEDVILAPLVLHKTNNIEVKFAEIKNRLSINGIFIGTFFSLNNLKELFTELAKQDATLCGQPIPRSLPLMDIKTIGMLLNNAGFKNPIVFTQNFEFTFKNLKDALYFIKHNGEANCLKLREGSFLAGSILKKTLANYKKNVTLNFEICFFSCLK